MGGLGAVGDDLDDPVVVVAARVAGDGTVQGGGVGEVERGRGRIGLNLAAEAIAGALSRAAGAAMVFRPSPPLHQATAPPCSSPTQPAVIWVTHPAAGCMGARLAVRAALRIALDA